MEIINFPADRDKHAETVVIDGHTVIMKYAPQSDPAVMESIKGTLLGQAQTPAIGPIICNID